MGNRILKKLLDVDTQKENKTFYTRDAQGNVLSIYENGKQKVYQDSNGNKYYFNAQNELIGFTNANGDNLFQWHIKGKLIFEEGQAFVCIDKINWGNCNDKIQLTDITDENLITQTEVPIYGSDRIGTYNPPSETNINSDIYILNRSYKRYELKDHLGNVRVTVSDSKRVSFVSETLVFSAEIKTYTDYYAFGMEMVGRNWSEGEAYRQGYNGKENDKDFGEGVQDYGMRVSDTQTCRFFSVDPITAQYPELTPYQFASNTPILCIDLDGLEGVIYNGKEIARGPVREECYQSVITSYKRGQGGIPVLPKLDHTQTQNKQSTIYVDSPNLNKVLRNQENAKSIWERGEKGIESDLTLFTLFIPAIKIGQNIPKLVQFGINLFSPVGVTKPKVFSNQGGEFLDDILNTSKAQRNFGTNEPPFFRAMSYAEFEAFEKTGGLTYKEGKELFVSQQQSYAKKFYNRENYDVLVQLNMKQGAMEYFNINSVTFKTPEASKGWAKRGFFMWKNESYARNLGIQSNTHNFNTWIDSYQVIKQKPK